MIRRPPRSTLFPYTRSSDLARFERLSRFPILHSAERGMRNAELKGRVVRLMTRSEEHTSELQSQSNLVCRLLLEKKKPLPPAPGTLDSLLRDFANHLDLLSR